MRGPRLEPDQWPDGLRDVTGPAGTCRTVSGRSPVMAGHRISDRAQSGRAPVMAGHRISDRAQRADTCERTWAPKEPDVNCLASA